MRSPRRAALAIVLVVAACGQSVPTDEATVVQPPATIADLRGPWQSRPLLLDPAFVAAVDAGCRPVLLRGSETGVPPVRPLVDARGGGYVIAIYLGEEEMAACDAMTIGPDGRVERATGFTSGQLDAAPVGPTELRAETTSGLDVEGDGIRDTPSWLLAKAGSEIVHVQATVAGQPSAVASRQGKWAFASWPRGGGSSLTLVGFDASGAEVTRQSLP